MDDATRTPFHEEADKAWAKPKVVGLEAITRPNRRGMILQKAALSLTGLSRGWSRANLADVVGDGAFRQGKAQFPQRTMNTFCTPQAMVECHGVDERNYGCRDTRWWRLGFGLVTPEQAETVSMPAEQRVGLDAEQRIPASHQSAGEQDEQSTIQGGERGAFRMPP